MKKHQFTKNKTAATKITAITTRYKSADSYASQEQKKPRWQRNPLLPNGSCRNSLLGPEDKDKMEEKPFPLVQPSPWNKKSRKVGDYKAVLVADVGAGVI